MREVDAEGIEDMFDLLIVANLTDDEAEKEKPREVFIDQAGLF